MGDKRNKKGIGLKRKFNLPGGIHSKRGKEKRRKKECTLVKKGENITIYLEEGHI